MRVGLGTTTIEPGRHGAGCGVTAYSYPSLRGGAALQAGQALARSFEAASLCDLLAPATHRLHMAADIFHATDYRVVRMDCPVVATLRDALPGPARAERQLVIVGAPAGIAPGRPWRALARPAARRRRPAPRLPRRRRVRLPVAV